MTDTADELKLVAPSLWEGSCLSSESTLHQIAPYIGKMKSTMAKTLIGAYSSPGDTVCDPFVGSGIVALESLIMGRGIIASDINPYAFLLTKAKLYPPLTKEKALAMAAFYIERMESLVDNISLDETPDWIKEFFHAQTLKELLAITKLLRKNREYFLLACILGILHHQRPGFLSYPASHLVPYLRTKKYPKNEYPKLYEYRALAPRLIKKIHRVYRRFPNIDPIVLRKCKRVNAINLNLPKESIDAVITSPPYMNTLDYARDNRLRLWFLGIKDYRIYDSKIPNNSYKFLKLMENCLMNLYIGLRKNKRCIFVIGDINRSKSTINTAKLVIELATSKCGFLFEDIIEDTIPNIRRARKNGACTKKEWIVILRRGE